ncbi:hypothetical protein QTN25_010449 [Entamoeba marina]
MFPEPQNFNTPFAPQLQNSNDPRNNLFMSQHGFYPMYQPPQIPFSPMFPYGYPPYGYPPYPMTQSYDLHEPNWKGYYFVLHQHYTQLYNFTTHLLSEQQTTIDQSQQDLKRSSLIPQPQLQPQQIPQPQLQPQQIPQPITIPQPQLQPQQIPQPIIIPQPQLQPQQIPQPYPDHQPYIQQLNATKYENDKRIEEKKKQIAEKQNELSDKQQQNQILKDKYDHKNQTIRQQYLTELNKMDNEVSKMKGFVNALGQKK